MRSILKQGFTRSALEFRTALGALLLIVIAATVLLYMLHLKQREQFQNEYRDLLKNNIQLNETRLLLKMDSLQRDVQFLARLPPIQGIVRASLNKGFDHQEGTTIHTWNQRFQDSIDASGYHRMRRHFHAMQLRQTGQQ